SDSALVEAGSHKYVIVGIAQDPRGGEWLERLAAPPKALLVGPAAASPQAGGPPGGARRGDGCGGAAPRRPGAGLFRTRWARAGCTEAEFLRSTLETGVTM